MKELYESIASKINGYRNGELPAPTPEHVERWVSQFTHENQEIILRETNHILEEIYITEQNVTDFLRRLARNKKLVGNDSVAFWRSAHIFRDQKHGNSLREMTDKLLAILQDEVGIYETGGADSNTFVYVDDFLFTGSRLFNDLRNWIEAAPTEKIDVHIVFIGYHKSGQWYTENRLKNFAKEKGKNISFTFWSMEQARLENRLRYKNTSDILWPTADICSTPEIAEYVENIDPDGEKIKFRVPLENNEFRLFSSESNRAILEREFTLAGLKIRSFCEAPSDSLKPLGFSPFVGFGFGAIVTTYRNCPNNCPLALWWGSPNASTTHPFSNWYPLLERKTYEKSDELRGFNIDDLRSLFK